MKVALSIKLIIARFLTKPIWGKIVKKSNVKTSVFFDPYNFNLVSDSDAASIFFGIWESAELRFVKKYINNRSGTIIELGSSVGVLASALSKRLNNHNFYLVEASPINVSILEKVVAHLGGNNNFSIINKAVAYNTEAVFFDHVGTISSSIYNSGQCKNSSYITTISLSSIVSKIVNENGMSPNGFTLISDIEGAEGEIFFNDIDSLSLCKTLITELEETDAFSKSVQINMLKAYGFKLQEFYDNVYVFVK
ncbi:MAG: FkbM family methyltransferase [Paracoccaceae bacterium]